MGNNEGFGCLAHKTQGPVVQSIVGLTSSLMVKMLTVLVSTISNSQVFLLCVAFTNAKATHIFSAKIFISTFSIFDDQRFNKRHR